MKATVAIWARRRDAHDPKAITWRFRRLNPRLALQAASDYTYAKCWRHMFSSNFPERGRTRLTRLDTPRHPKCLMRHYDRLRLS